MMKRISLNACGKMNLRTGENKHFNVLKDWNSDALLTIVVDDLDRVRVIGGWGGCGELGDRVEIHSSSGRYLITATLSRTYPCTPEGLAAIRSDIGKNSVTFGTLD